MIRFWEKEFDVLKPKKNAKGNRKFTPEDIKNLIENDANKPSQIEKLEVAGPYLNIFLGSGSFAESF